MAWCARRRRLGRRVRDRTRHRQRCKIHGFEAAYCNGNVVGGQPEVWADAYSCEGVQIISLSGMLGIDMGNHLVQSSHCFKKSVDREQLDVMGHPRVCELLLPFQFTLQWPNFRKGTIIFLGCETKCSNGEKYAAWNCTRSVIKSRDIVQGARRCRAILVEATRVAQGLPRERI